jgi:hypothetical protein
MTYKKTMSAVERLRAESPETVKRVSIMSVSVPMSISDGNDNGCLKQQQQQDVCTPAIVLGDQKDSCRPASAGLDTQSNTRSSNTDQGLSWMVSCGFEIEFNSNNSNSKPSQGPQGQFQGQAHVPGLMSGAAAGVILVPPRQLLRGTGGVSERSVVTFATKLDTLHVWDADHYHYFNDEDYKQDDTFTACSASADSSFADVRSASGEDTYFSQSFVAAYLGGQGMIEEGGHTSFSFAEEEEECEGESTTDCTSAPSSMVDTPTALTSTLTPTEALTLLEQQHQEGNDDCRESEIDVSQIMHRLVMDSSEDQCGRHKHNLSQHSYFSGVDNYYTCDDSDGVDDNEQDTSTSFCWRTSSVLQVLPVVPSPAPVYDYENDDFLLPFHEHAEHHFHDDDADDDDQHSETTFLNGVSFDEADEASFADAPPVLLSPRGFLLQPPKNKTAASIFHCLFCPSW